jgi:ATP-dependent Lon protease
MFRGSWHSNVFYKKGDIVFAGTECFICSKQHYAEDLVFPNQECLYWVEIDKNIVTIPAMHPLDLYPPFTNPPSPNYVPQLQNPPKMKSMKRKLDSIEKSIENYKRQKNDHDDIADLREKLLLLNVDIPTKTFLVDKYDGLQRTSATENSKGMSWLKVVTSIPFGKYKQVPISAEDKPEKLKEFFAEVKKKLDEDIYGMEDVKQEILEYVARKITNPKGKGHVLALCGPKGLGKTKILKSLARALDLPFYQINCGGLNDVSILTGHSETYVGSKAGKIVEILANSRYMNPIIYLDEIDKISDIKSQEINGILTHLLDEEQNDKFQDNYLSNVPIDLSNVFFAIAFNDITKVDDIVSDRMKVIYISKPTLEEKVLICQEKVLPDIIKNINFDIDIQMDKEVIEYVILNKCENEQGVRQLKKTLEKVLNKLNYDILVGNASHLINDEKVCYITKSYIDSAISSNTKEDASYLSMYM